MTEFNSFSAGFYAHSSKVPALFPLPSVCRSRKDSYHSTLQVGGRVTVAEAATKWFHNSTITEL